MVDRRPVVRVYTAMSPRFRITAICAALAMLVMMVLLLVRPSLDPARIRPLPLLIAAWLAFLAAAWLLRSVSVKIAVGLILAGGVAVQVAAVSAPPQNSNDLYRYIWDGNVQAAGIDAYAYVPASRALEDLRNNYLWYPGAEYCVGSSSAKASTVLASGCTRINRPTVPTIYPPVAEAYFLGVHYLPDASDSSTPIQSATAGIAVLTTLMLLFGLRRLGRDVRMAALWSWCPTLAGPAVLRRRWITVVASAASAFTVVYVPHLIAVGSKVIGFLPGYLQQEGYDNGTRFGIIDLVAGGHTAIVIAVAVLGVTGLLVLRFADPDQPWRGAVVMTAAALAVATPHYQWYALLLVMLVALDGRPEWLAFAAGGYYAQEPDMGRSFTVPTRYHDAVAYGIPVLVALAGWAWRVWRASRSRHARPVTVPVPVAVSVPVTMSVPVTVSASAVVPAGAAADGTPSAAAMAAEEYAISSPPLRSILG
jgi:hypothetical protein